MTEYLMPAKYAKLLLKVAQEQGYDVNQLIYDAGLSFNPLELNTDEELEIPAIIFSKLYRKVSGAMQDEAFGLGTTYKMPPGTFRMLCYCIIHCSSLRKALDRTTEFTAMTYGIRGITVKAEPPYRVSADGSEATLVYSSASNKFNAEMTPAKQLSVVNSLSLWHRFCSWLIGNNIAVKRVNLMGSPSLNLSGYRYYFDCPIEFDQQENSIVINAQMLDAPLVHTEESLESFLETAPYQLFVIKEEQGSDSIIPRIRALIGYNFTRRIPSFDELAELLNISPRTLRRRLEKEGTSYQKVKDECRRDASIDYLSRPNLTINSVAALMGFDEPSAFHRSFKKWTDMTPGEFRKQNNIQMEDIDEVA
ncbi:AraC family transcriptional regulator [Endozoicomonas atrinae]|uniref:AraC family transcriptional regulator n=1 Tax=Endozoicomonas atrinae TaxID=1333660 RepID=UPI0008241CDD|nr:AraC family transcriptional regulator [Endozoicomonas atrinae]